jgi:hypothetical protein
LILFIDSPGEVGKGETATPQGFQNLAKYASGFTDRTMINSIYALVEQDHTEADSFHQFFLLGHREELNDTTDGGEVL